MNPEKFPQPNQEEPEKKGYTYNPDEMENADDTGTFESERAKTEAKGSEPERAKTNTKGFEPERAKTKTKVEEDLPFEEELEDGEDVEAGSVEEHLPFEDEEGSIQEETPEGGAEETEKTPEELTPERLKEIEKNRKETTKDLREGGATYRWQTEDGKPVNAAPRRLEATEEQVEEARREMEEDLAKRGEESGEEEPQKEEPRKEERTYTYADFDRDRQGEQPKAEEETSEKQKPGQEYEQQELFDASESGAEETPRQGVERETGDMNLEEASRKLVEMELAVEKAGLAGQRIKNAEYAEELARIEDAYRDAFIREIGEKIPFEELDTQEAAYQMAQLPQYAGALLVDVRTELKNAERTGERGDAVKKRVAEVVNKYRELPMRYKMLAAGGFLGAGAAAGAAGGATGAAIATGAFMGRRAQRWLSGAAAATGLEGLAKKWQEKRDVVSLEKEFHEDLLLAMENKDLELTQKITQKMAGEAVGRSTAEYEKKLKKQERRRWVGAGAVGAIIGSGATGAILEKFGLEVTPEEAPEEDITPDEPTPEPDDVPEPEARPEVPEPEEPEPSEEPGPDEPGEPVDEPEEPEDEPVSEDGEVVSPEELATALEGLPAEYTVEAGDNLWNVIDSNLVEAIDDKLDLDLAEGQKQNIIGNALEVIKENPQEFGVASGDVSLIHPGETINLEKITETINSPITIDGVEYDNLIERAQALTPEEVSNIEAYPNS